jgi:hypothetical protein
MTEQMRRCTRCCEELAAERFAVGRAACRDCKSAYERECYAKRKRLRQDALESGLEPGASRGRIYCISAPGCDKVYVGSTRLTLCQRLCQHHADRRKWQRGRRRFISSFDVLAYPGAVIRILEEGDYATMPHMCEREAHWIGRLPCVNIRVPWRLPSVNIHGQMRRPRTAKMVCPTCGKITHTKTIKRHTRSRACSLLALSVRA